MPKSQLCDLIRDTYRFIRSYRGIIEKAPLQAYVTALIFSPTRSLIRGIFKAEEPGWIVTKPVVEENWSAYLTTLEGHSDCANSVAFSGDSTRLASASDDNTIKLWD